MKELDFQSYLVKAAVETGGHAFKCNNRFLVGIPDLSMKLQAYPHVYIECKMDKLRKDGTVHVDLTPLQRKFIREHQAAGGFAGWAVACPFKRGYLIITGSNCDAKVVRVDVDVGPGHNRHFRKHGGKWPVEFIVEDIIQHQNEQAKCASSSLDTAGMVRTRSAKS